MGQAEAPGPHCRHRQHSQGKAVQQPLQQRGRCEKRQKSVPHRHEYPGEPRAPGVHGDDAARLRRSDDAPKDRQPGIAAPAKGPQRKLRSAEGNVSIKADLSPAAARLPGDGAGPKGPQHRLAVVGRVQEKAVPVPQSHPRLLWFLILMSTE